MSICIYTLYRDVVIEYDSSGDVWRIASPVTPSIGVNCVYVASLAFCRDELFINHLLHKMASVNIYTKIITNNIVYGYWSILIVLFPGRL
jgi:hypothetical protein